MRKTLPPFCCHCKPWQAPTITSPPTVTIPGPASSPLQCHEDGRSLCLPSRTQDAVGGLTTKQNLWPSLYVKGPIICRRSSASPPAIQAPPRHPVTGQNYPGETPIVSGGVPVGEELEAHLQGTLWRESPVLPTNTAPFEYLFYNGEHENCAHASNPLPASMHWTEANVTPPRRSRLSTQRNAA